MPGTVWTEDLRMWVLLVDSITLITGLPANLLALFIFIRKMRQRATPLDVLLLNLNISDLVFLLFLPFHTKEAADMKWTVSYFLCPLSGFIFYSTFHNSILLLTAIGVERYLGVAFPIAYKLKRDPRMAVLASFMIWILSMGHCSIVYFMQYYKHNKTQLDPSHKNSCYKEFSDEQLSVLLPFRLELAIVLFSIPFIISCFCYVKFIFILSRLPNFNRKKRLRAIGLALVTFLVFIICFMPLNLSHVVGFIYWNSPKWRVYALLPSTLNASLDPFIFYFSSSALRDTINHSLRRLAIRLSFRFSTTENKQTSRTEESSRDNQLQTTTDF
ncbi:free fatty acid receptor 3-like [Trichomycterus rosablanca]|uniref:free fatty acid receptor 3-like n=1 Tax=Trichomycterus rosablanca TaxID=2290929 RepID=UPI002F35479A